MSPDSPLGQLAQRVARIEQRMEDVIARFTERVGDMAGEIRRLHEDADRDIRAFAPAVQDIDRHGVRIEYVIEQVNSLHRGLESLDKRMDLEREQRILGQEERKRELREAQEAAQAEIERVQREAAAALRDAITDREKQTRELKNRITLALLTLAGLFVTSGVTLVASLLGGSGHG
jgi:DNA repair exonuclease SbcCD ATPase subunit